MSEALVLDPQREAELIAVKRRKLELVRKKLAVARADGLALYRPHPQQDAFHRAGVRFRVRGVRAANRWGKSHCGCAEDLAWLRGERTWYPVDDIARRGGIPQRPVKLLTITTDWDKVDEIWTSKDGEKMSKVWKMAPTGFIKSTSKNHSGCIDTIVCANKSLWRFDTVKSFAQNPQGQESSDWDAIHIDEPCPKGMYVAAARGLMDRQGSTWFTLTALCEPWINDLLFPADTKGLARDDVWAITGTIWDNPYISPEAIEAYSALLTDEEKECRLKGLSLHLAGLVYKQFSWDKHVLKDLPKGWKSWTEPPMDWNIYFHIDFHPRVPHCVLFLAVSPLQQRVYFYDIFEHDTPKVLADRIRKVIGPRHVSDARMDPSGFIEDPITQQTSFANELAKNGVFVQPANKDLRGGILKVQQSLAADPQEVWFTPAACRVLWEIQRWCWKEDEDKPIDADDHAVEGLYRLEMLEPRWSDPGNYTLEVPELDITKPEIETDDLEFALD